MRILIWHGYLLGGTGSNVYTRSLARTWSRAGHDVVVLCQEPHPERYDLGGATVVRPPVDGPLPVFVVDSYEDMVAQRLPDVDPQDRQRFVEQNVAAVRAQGPADLLLVNHVLLGGPVGAGSGLPYVVKAHGSELEFAIRDHPDLQRWARASLDGAGAVVAGSEHVARVLAELVGPDPTRVHVVPPGVDVETLRPRDRREALEELVAECRRDLPNAATAHDPRLPDEGNADRLAAFLAGDRPTVVYVGKLSLEKGVHLLLDALAGLGARCVVVGFGPSRADLEQASGPDVLFTGPLEHRHLAQLWPLADVSVVPSVFPEAFGMVAAEAAACGSPPLVAHHSGLAEVAAGVAARYPGHLRHLASFPTGDTAELAARLGEVLELPRAQWQRLSAGARSAAEELWSWEGVGARLLALPGGIPAGPAGTGPA